jgi:hypothetical protein
VLLAKDHRAERSAEEDALARIGQDSEDRGPLAELAPRVAMGSGE